MKIGLVLESDLAIPGGVQEYVRGLYDHLVSAGHQVDILTARGREAGASGRSVIRLGRSVDIPIPGSSASTPLIRVSARTARGHLEQGEYDILHFQGPGGIFNSRILKRSRAVNIVTYHVHHAGVIPNLAGFLWPWERRLSHQYARRIAVSPVWTCRLSSNRVTTSFFSLSLIWSMLPNRSADGFWKAANRLGSRFIPKMR